MNSVSKSDDSSKNGASWQMEILMEKLRSKACSLKSLPDSAKAIKQSILNKQHILDPGEKATLGQCLDKLQQNIKVTSLPAMVERLEATARQLGLQFTSATSGPEVYISCDMFYVEVHLQNEGKVRDVKIELAGDQFTPRGHSIPELAECLSSGNFTDFMSHLEGFLSIYKLNTEKKSKCKAYQTLQALELDLLKLFELAQETITDTHRLIFKSPVGLLIDRKGGHPVKIIYFNSPYELLDVAAQKSVSLTYETASSMDLAHYVTVNIEASTSHKLQTVSLVNIIKGNDGLKLPSISGLNSSNSVSLPAYFTLRLKNPMAVSYTLACKISEITGIPCFEASSKQPLLPLIVRLATDVQPDNNNNKGLFVTLPDQQHCYFMPNGGEFEGVIVQRVPFTHPTSVAHILEFLRTQALFNSLITSCVRPDSKQDLENAFIFEVSAVSHEFLSVTFEHPEEESTATAELDLTDLSNVRCRLFTLSKDVTLCSDEYATKVLQRCLSIPITMRAVIRKVAKEEKEVLPQGDSVVKMESNNLPSDPNQNTKFLFNDYNNLGMRRDHVVSSHSNGLNNVVTKSPSSTQATYGASVDNNAPICQTTTSVTYGPLLGTVAPQKNQYQQQQQQHFLSDGKTAKVRKRKSILDSERKSPKFSDDIVIEVNKKSSSSDSLLSDSLPVRRDVKFEKVHSVISKRRSSTDGGLSTPGANELNALREKVYGAASAANFAKLSYMHNKDSKDMIKDSNKKFKKQKSESGTESKKSPIVLDLTDAESTKKATLSSSVGNTSHSSSSTSLSAALLKRPGIEIIPIPGSNTPISIPSSITVTPVMKSSDDKYKDKKEKRDKKELEKKEKKRRRDDSPSNSGGSGDSSMSSGKPSKIQIISTNSKHSSSVTTIENIKSDKSIGGVTVKPSSQYQSPIKKSSLSPTLSQKSVSHSKVTFSPSHKQNKLVMVPNQTSSSTSSTSSSSSSSSSVSSTSSTSSSSSSLSSSKGTSSPKQCCSPKHSSLSPKHSSIGKPSMNTLKTSSPTFSKPSALSPKLSKSGKEKDKSCSPSRTSVSSIPSSSNISPNSVKSKSTSSSEKTKGTFSEALTITKVSSGETISTSVTLSSTSISTFSSNQTNASLVEKLSIDKAKASPPKNRKGSSLSDIVDKLRAGVTGSSDNISILERKEKDKRDGTKSGQDNKKEDNFMIKTSTGLKFTINKAKAKESSKSGSSSYSSSNSSSPNSKNSSNKSPSGLKPGVMSAPASKKVSLSSLPPIPKLSPTSIANVTQTSVSPLGHPLSMTSPLQYGRDRQRESKDREREKERSGSSSDKNKSKDNLSSNKSSFASSESKKDTTEKNFISKQGWKEDQRTLSSTTKKISPTDTVDRALKNMFGEDSTQTSVDIQENDTSDCFDKNNSSCKMTSFSSETRNKLEPKDLPLENAKESSSMPPPTAPAKHVPEKDEVNAEKEQESVTLPPPPPPPPLPPPTSVPPQVLPPRVSSPPNHSFPPSPSVSIKIVKSPAPVTSPLNMISPQSVSSQHSPCIIDDELMDEAVVLSRK